MVLTAFGSLFVSILFIVRFLVKPEKAMVTPQYNINSLKQRAAYKIKNYYHETNSLTYSIVKQHALHWCVFSVTHLHLVFNARDTSYTFTRDKCSL